jgi:hypothetical protein
MKRLLPPFFIAVFLFLVANIVALFARSDPIDDPDSTERYGFPFLISANIGGVHPIYFSAAALCGDVAVGLLSSALAAAIYAHLRPLPPCMDPTTSLHSTPR